MKKVKQVLSGKEIEERNKEKNIKRFIVKRIINGFVGPFMWCLMLCYFPYIICFIIIVLKENSTENIIIDWMLVFLIVCLVWSAFFSFCITKVTTDVKKIRREAIDKLYPDPLIKATEEFFGKRFEKFHQ